MIDALAKGNEQYTNQKKWDVNLKIYGIPEEEYEQFITDVEILAKGKELILTIDFGTEENEND